MGKYKTELLSTRWQCFVSDEYFVIYDQAQKSTYTIQIVIF